MIQDGQYGPFLLLNLFTLLKMVNVKFTLQQTMMAKWGGYVQHHSFFNLGTRLGWVFNAMPWPLPHWR